MRKAFKHTSALLLVAVIGLALVGAAYALWFEDLSLTANVSTGTFNADGSIHDLDITTANAAANEGLPVVYVGSNPQLVSTNYGAYTQAQFPANKPQPTCDGVLGVYGTGGGVNSNDTVDLNAINLTLTGLYPYAGCEYEIDVHNSGSVPFHIAITGVSLQQCDITGTPCVNILLAPWTIGLDPAQADLARCAAFLGAIVAFTGTPFQINTAPNTPVQIHGGDELACRFKLILDQSAPENTMFKFSVTYRAYQWNEAPFGP